MIEPGLYKHYKGKLYEVVAVATHSESLEPMVVYKTSYQPEGNNWWVRPAKMFSEQVRVGDNLVPRFEKL